MALGQSISGMCECELSADVASSPAAYTLPFLSASQSASSSIRLPREGLIMITPSFILLMLSLLIMLTVDGLAEQLSEITSALA